MQLQRASLALSLASFVVFLVPAVVHAGIPECGNLRLEDVSACEIRADAECMGSCMAGIYKVACATRRYRECRTECTVSAMPTCTDSCTVMCQGECDAGVSITCQHNCFAECQGSCTTRCNAMPAGDMRDQCTASCQATCDGECDARCPAVVDGSCYTHCVECCHGSCSAQANMDCQETCQDREFEDCEHELRAECDASCSVDGSLFCDGKFVLSGAQVPACIDALIARGINARAEGSVTLGGDGAKTSCSVGEQSSRGGAAAVFFGLGIGAVLAARRRRR